jgi:hypothetical protein
MLGGCGTVVKYDVEGWQEQSDSSEAPTTAVPATPIELVSVAPAFGSTIGGSVVRIEGGPFDRFSEVYVGAARARLISVDEDLIVVETPEGVEGATELRVVSDGAEASHSFMYWPDASGLVGLTGTIAYIDVVGDYWAAGNADRALAEITLIEPVEYESWQEYSETFNGCSADWAMPSMTSADGGAMGDITLISASTNLDLSADGDGWYGEEGVAPGQTYGLEPSGEWAGLTLEGLAEVPVGLRLLSPDLDVAAPPKVSKQFALDWDKIGVADYVAIVLEKSHWDSVAGALVIDQKVSCAVADTGSFTVPGSMWTDWTTDDVVTVYVGRIREGGGTLPHNNSESAVTGAYWVAGAVRAK